MGARSRKERRNRESIKMVKRAREAHRPRERQSYHCATPVKASASSVARCYALKAVGSSGLIAAPVVRRAVRVDEAGNAGKAAWSCQGASHSPERRIAPLKPLANGIASSEAVRGREGESPPFFVPIHDQPTVSYRKPADFQWKGNCLPSKNVSVLLSG